MTVMGVKKQLMFPVRVLFGLLRVSMMGIIT